MKWSIAYLFRLPAFALINFLAILIGALALFSILKIALGGGAAG